MSSLAHLHFPTEQGATTQRRKLAVPCPMLLRKLHIRPETHQVAQPCIKPKNRREACGMDSRCLQAARAEQQLSSKLAASPGKNPGSQCQSTNLAKLSVHKDPLLAPLGNRLRTIWEKGPRWHTGLANSF